MDERIDNPGVSSGDANPFSLCADLYAPFQEKLDDIRSQAAELAQNTDASLADRLNALIRRIDSFSPSVALVGQVKAGKTALANVLSGTPGLLPSDVNPLTSVVTTLHLNGRHPDGRTRAAFTLFDRKEWDALTRDGGHLGKLAMRAGAEDEAARLRAQVDQMRRQAQARFGSGFEALLGKIHKYSYCERDLVERYVSMGDPATDSKGRRSRFADITRSADLYVDHPHLPGRMSLRDTPGVNDTFLVREQITLRSLARTDVCIVVLSAHEALSTADMALMRMISALEDRQVVLFVNRIDELERPSEQVPEIRASILATLAKTDGGRSVELVFGSARWAEIALNGGLGQMNEAERAALYDWASVAGQGAVRDASGFTWRLSGVPELMAAVYRRILDRPARRMIEGVNADLGNILAEIRAAQAAREQATEEEIAELGARLQAAADAQRARLDTALDRLIATLRQRLHRVQENYVERATRALIDHVRRTGRHDTWSFGTSGLRFVLKSTYMRFSHAATIEVEEIYRETAETLSGIWRDYLGLAEGELTIEPPQVPEIPAPTAIGQTIAVDLGVPWWKRWWLHRKDEDAMARDYADLIRAEVATIVSDLETVQFNEVMIEMRAILDDFTRQQIATILRVARGKTEPQITLQPMDAPPGSVLAASDAKSGRSAA
ncbi:dynamin family protein [Albidovulum inexpectatum]|uniref:Dynamin family protein n=1 Tax=Albidovulum inexpectatum TaxID=196587 RepID=A0A2S5JMC3_9RHOB|nr:dynamin family protein [Albidovulum inexpectatum]PPB82600.1 dynamin family protein [Albidovulum inexpectatum]